MTLEWTHETMGGDWIGDEFHYVVATTPAGRKYRWHRSCGLQYLTEHGHWTHAKTSGFDSDNLTLMVDIAEQLLLVADVKA